MEKLLCGKPGCGCPLAVTDEEKVTISEVFKLSKEEVTPPIVLLEFQVKGYKEV